MGGGLWGGWRVVGWLGSSGEARRSCSEAAQLLGGCAVPWRRRVTCAEAAGAGMAVFRRVQIYMSICVFWVFADTGATRTTALARGKKQLTTARQDGDRGAA